MGMRPPRMCAKCHANALQGKRYCAKHEALVSNRPRNILRPLYKCKRWFATRAFVLSRDPICTKITNGARCVQLATNVHHVIDALDWVDQGGDFYDTDNLAGLCQSHHSSHTAKEQGFASG